LIGDTGAVWYLAYGTSSPITKYVSGSMVAPTDRLMLCQQHSTGRLHSCTSLELGLANNGGSTEYWCGPDPDDGGDTHCDCAAGWDCLQMIVADGACDDPIVCDDLGCSCPF
jgi:hypothetical protein